VPEEKSQRVASYISNFRSEVDVITHSCGVLEPRQLQRMDVRIRQANGRSLPQKGMLDETQQGENVQDNT